MKKLSIITFALFTTTLFAPTVSFAQECFLGEVKWFAGNFAPRSWAKAEGQILSIAQNQALFSILGTTYGGDGRTTFGLPNLRGRSAIGAGRGPGLSDRRLGSTGGVEKNTQVPAHSHALNADLSGATTSSPAGSALAKSGSYSSARPGATALHTSSVGNTGVAGGVENMHPYTTLTPIICIQGTFPSRN